MSAMDKISMALDDVVKAERKEYKKTGKKTGGAKKGGIGNGKVDPSTAKLVQKLVKRALSQRRAGKPVTGGKPRRTVVKKVVQKVGTPKGKARNVRRNNKGKDLPLNQRSRTIVRKVVREPRPATQTIVREIRYVREPVRRQQPRNQRVIVRHAQPQRRVVYVQQPRRSNFQRRPTSDPFYQPRNFLQRY